MELEIAKVSCVVTIDKRLNQIKTIANAAFMTSQHNSDCAFVPVGKRIKHFMFSFFDNDHRGQQRKGTKCCFFVILGSAVVLEQQLIGSLCPGLQ